VVEAAEDEFARHGFSGGSLNVIARNAGVAKGSLFQYFADKADLYAHLSELASLRIRAQMESQIEEMDWDGRFFDALRTLMVAWEEYFHSHPRDLAVTAAVNLEPDRSARFAVRHVVNEHYLVVLHPLVAAAKERGDLRDDADLDAFLALLLLLLPHLALAPHSPGLDPLLGLGSPRPSVRRSAVGRVVDVLEAAFGPNA
jgi:AcrR family transcriptional regulator